MRKCLLFLFLAMLTCLGCQWQLRPSALGPGNGIDRNAEELKIIVRYDLLEHSYLTTGDFSSLQQMTAGYPVQTRILIEDVLHIGQANTPEVMHRLLDYFQDSTLQVLLADVQEQYATMGDVDRSLFESFNRLKEMLPSIDVPKVYTQIGSLDQSITVNKGLLGISLDKYLGADYPLYQRYGYSQRQCESMTRDFIVPDCIGFFLLSLYPTPLQEQRREHLGRIQYVVNKAVGHQHFDNQGVADAGAFMASHPETTFDQLLR